MKIILALSLSFMFFGVLSFLVIKSELRDSKKITFKAEPIVEIRKYKNKSYTGTKLEESLTYGYGYLEEPNKFILRKSYEWRSHDKNRKAKKLTGKNMVASFDADTLIKMIAGAPMRDIEMQKGFSFIGQGFDLESESATYYLKNDTLLGTDPVYITGKDTRIHSSDGFKVEVNKGEFELFGSVNGVLENVDLIK